MVFMGLCRRVLAAVGAEALAGALLKIGDALGPLRGQAVSVGGFSALNARMDQLLGDPMPPTSPTLEAVLPVVSALILSPLLCTIGTLLWYVVLGPSLLWGLRPGRSGKGEQRHGLQAVMGP